MSDRWNRNNEHYVSGFMFSEDMKQVALIHKKCPDWMAGKLNAIGGYIEPNKSPIKAMIREFNEETGVLNQNWKSFCRISQNTKFSVTFFCTTGILTELKTTTDEKVEICNVSDVKHFEVIENLDWLIPLALDFMEDGKPSWTEVNYPTARD